jgi:arylsulfatase A
MNTKPVLLSSFMMAGPLMAGTIAAEKPNVIIIYNDDMGYRDLGCYGAPKIKTPRIDQMANEGVRFNDFYSCSPVSSASRASLMTGCYPQRVGVMGVIGAGSNSGLNPEHVTIAEVLKSVGYATAAVGKWHLGDMQKFLPTNQGFDSYYGIPYSNDMFPSRHAKYAENCLWRNGFSLDSLNRVFAKLEPNNIRPNAVKENVPLIRNLECIEYPVDQTTLTQRYANEGIQFIEKSVADKKPFFLYLANSMPHVPLFVSPEFKGKSQHGLYGDVIEEIDFNTGRILDKLKELGIDKNTIVIFSSDNGPWLQYKEHSGSALPLYEGKFTCFDGGMRVPCIVRWPDQIPAGNTSSVLVATIDILPTLAGITGAKLPETELDGKDILNIWKGESDVKSPHDYFFYAYDAKAVRSGDWKYHKNRRYTTTQKIKMEEIPALYNLKDDIGETNNLIDKEPEIAARLAKALDEHLVRINMK